VTLFKDKIALITGAGSGIGMAVALALGKEGAKLCLVGRNMEKLEVVATTVQENGSEAKYYRADLTVDTDIRKLADELSRGFKGLDILIHSAGFISLGVMESAAIKDLDQHYYVNVRAPYMLTQLLLPMLIANQGQIVFINSTVAMMTARAKQSQYAATKHALKAIADSLRDEVNADGIRVLSVYPGRTATPMQSAVHEMEGRMYHPERLMQPDDVAGVIINALTLSRSAELTDIMIRPLVKTG
jgi:NADP-dependent 3-hydroxy acid dehydrogenase YdfG